MNNDDTSVALKYHNFTKHSPYGHRSYPYALDPRMEPIPYKIYDDERVEQIPFPDKISASEITALDAISSNRISHDRDRVPTLQELSQILYFSAGITKVINHGDHFHHFRAAACTGALYHIDLYAICGKLPDLKAGVYHFDVRFPDMKLNRIRDGDYRGTLENATGNETSVIDAPVTIAFASTFWRNSWKYNDRTYRHCFWDNGTILANTLAEASALNLPTKLVMGFVDDEVNRLLDIDSEFEATMSLVPLGYAPSMRPTDVKRVEPLNLKTIPLSESQINYTVVSTTHSASNLSSSAEVKKWRKAPLSYAKVPPKGKLVQLQPIAKDQPTDSIEKVIIKRGSTREFDPTSITFQEFSTILDASTHGIPFDFLGNGGYLNDMYLLVNDVNGLDSGSYVLHRENRALELLEKGNFREHARFLDLGQDLAGDASVNVYFLTDLKSVLEHFGDRGYRVAQLEAAITGGKLYLAAYALKLGASGITFYDDPVTDFFSPHAEGKSTMFLTVIGNSPRRSKK
ncbi:MAG: SagB/ThcOx family dehydrogenase [Nitrososphaerales archaeon]